MEGETGDLLRRTVMGRKIMVREWHAKVQVEEVGDWNGAMDVKGEDGV